MGDLIGKTLADRYVVERLLGEGGMGSVYAARQLGLDRMVAVKVLRPEVAGGSVEAERFRREALAAARLAHPNIVTVFDFGRLPDDSAFLVMELLTGPSLDRVLGSGSVLDAELCVRVFEPIASAIDALHAAGIVHRDIKPANIALPDRDDPNDVVKLIDLGIARFSDASKSDLTGQMIIGTVDYIAPEVATGSKASAASDIYALGITVFEALTGSPPFTGSGDREILIKHIKEPPPAVSNVKPEVPSGFDAVLMHALAKDPAARYPSAREFASAMRDALATPRGEPRAVHRRAARTVLVVDGDAATREFARGCLAAFGYEIVEAADAVEALLLFGGRSFDLVIANAVLPGLDGVTLLRLKHEKGIHTPTILLTADGGLPDGVTAESHGIASAVALPLDAGALFGAVTAALAGAA